MSILKNIDIYNPKQGNPFEPIETYLDLLDKKIDIIKANMQMLEKLIKSTGTGGQDAKKIIENTQKLTVETQKLNTLTAAKSNINEKLKVEQQILNQQTKEQIKLQSGLTGAYQKESIQLNQLRKAYKDLAIQEKANTKEGREMLKTIQALDAKLKGVDASVGQFTRNVGNYTSAFGRFGASLKNFFIGTLFVGIASKIGSLIGDMKKLAEQASGTQRAFDELNQPGLLNELKQATGETVSDVELMKRALDADDLNVNLSNLPLYFKFARKEVQETGGSVTDLVDKIIKGLGKESPKAVTELGIPMKEFKEELAKTGDYATALNNIITERLGNSKYIETAADVTARWAARWENIKASAGSLIDTVLVKISPILEGIWNGMISLWKSTTKFIIDTYNGFVDVYNESKLFRTIIESIGLTFDVLWETVKLFFSAFTGQLKAIGKTLAYTFNPANWGSGFKDGLGRILAENGQEIINNFKSFGKKIGEETFDAINNSMDGQMKKLTPEDFMLSGGTGAFTTQGGEGASGGGQAKTDDSFAKAQAELQKETEMMIAEHEKRMAAIADINAKLAEKDLENSQAWKEMKADEVEFWAEIDAKQKEDELKRLEEFEKERQDIVKQSMEAVGASLGQLFIEGEEGFKNFGKNMLQIALTALEKFLELQIAAITIKEIGGKGLIGIGTSAFLIGLVKGAFGAAKAKIQGFATGTEYVSGGGTETSDSIPAMLSKGERVVPAAINKQLMGIPNEKLPLVLNQNLQSLKMETMLNEIGLHTKLSAMYLANGRNDWQDGNFKYYQDWKTGQIKRKLRD